MVTRVSMTVINQSEATDDGKILITGAGRRGQVQVELPGEAAQMLIASILLFLPKLAKRSTSGTKPSFQMAGFELKSTNDPTGLVDLSIRCAVPASGSFEVLDVGFSLSWEQVTDMGSKLVAAANNRKPEPPPTRN
jgi:hypothetical protein